MKVKLNTEKGEWELHTEEGVVVDAYKNDGDNNTKAAKKFLLRQQAKIQEGAGLLRDLLNHREDYSIILMPDWVDHAEEYCNDSK